MLKTIFFIVMQTHAGGQRYVGVADAEVVLELRLDTLRDIGPVVRALDDRVVRTVIALEKRQRSAVSSRVVQYSG